MAFREQYARASEHVKQNRELISVLSGALLAAFGLGGAVLSYQAEKKVFHVQLEKERELQEKGEDGLQKAIDKAKAEAAADAMRNIFDLGFHDDFSKFREEFRGSKKGDVK